MSIYAVQKAMFVLKKDPAFAQAVREEPDTALASFDLSSCERQAFVSGDLSTLYRMGVHPLLLAPYSRAMGIPRPAYQASLAPLKGTRLMRSELEAEVQASTLATPSKEGTK